MALLLSLPFWGEGLGLHREPAAGPRLTEDRSAPGKGVSLQRGGPLSAKFYLEGRWGFDIFCFVFSFIAIPSRHDVLSRCAAVVFVGPPHDEKAPSHLNLPPPVLP